MMTLAEYLDIKGIPQKAFAERVGVRQATVSRLASGLGKPSLELAVSIERETGGSVTAASWVADKTEAAE